MCSIRICTIEEGSCSRPTIACSVCHIFLLYHIFNYWIKVSRKGRYSTVSFHLLAFNLDDKSCHML